MPTITEKILTSAGNFVITDMDCAAAHYGTGVPAIKAFREMYVKKSGPPER